MRNFLFFMMMLVCSIFLFSCDTRESQQTSNHEVRWSPDQKDSVVYVNHVAEDGSSNSFFMNYLLFRSLFGSGGYNSCYSYYQQHPAQFVAGPTAYGNYTTRSTHTESANTSRSYSSPGRTSTSSSSKSYTSPARSTPSTSRSYSSPSRTTSSPSYTSPSRSYTSPARSYTSPARSYSSPARH